MSKEGIREDQSMERNSSQTETFEPLNVGVVGCGEQMTDNLLPCLDQIDTVNLREACDIDRTRAERTKRKYGLHGIYEDYEVMLDDEDIDLVVAASSPEVHAQLARECLRRNIHVFVEKPPARDLQTLKELARLERDSDAFAGVGLNFRHAERVHSFHEVVNETFTSEPHFMNVRFVTDKPSGPLWGLDSHVRSVMLATGIHALDLAFMFMGTPQTVDATVSRGDAEALTIVMQLRYDNGNLCTITVSSASPRFDLSMDLISNDLQQASMSQLRNITVRNKNDTPEHAGISNKRWEKNWRPSPLSHRTSVGYRSEITSFVRAARSESNWETTFTNTIPLYRTIEETIASLDGGKDGW